MMIADIAELVRQKCMPAVILNYLFLTNKFKSFKKKLF